MAAMAARASDDSQAWQNGQDDGDGEEYLPVERMRRQYLDYVGAKALEIEEQKIGRHYYHSDQWTHAEIETLKKRGQPIVTYNRINRKIDGIVGLVEKLRADPKAFPRNPRNEDGAEVATQTVRFVLDSNAWKQIDHDCTEQRELKASPALNCGLRKSSKAIRTSRKIQR